MYILPETAAYRLLVKDGAVVGVRSGDKGCGRDGSELQNFEPGSDLIGRVTVLAEGTQGHLADAAIRHFGLASRIPRSGSMCPAVYEVPEEALEQLRSDGGSSEHTLVDVQVTPSNCIQCGAITAKAGRVTPTEGGDGPNYDVT